MAFFHGEDRVYIDTILNAGATVTITPNDTIQFDKVVLTFSGDAQNFREIEILGVPTLTVVSDVIIAGKDTVLKGNTISLTATVSGANEPSETVTWSSRSPNIATVSSSGEVTGVAGGTAEIIATSQLNPMIADTVTIMVQSVNSISITGPDTVLWGEYPVLVADVSVTHGAPKTVTWSSSDENVIIVFPTGEIETQNPGTATITATSTVDSTKKASKVITVPTPMADSVIISGIDSVLVGTHTIFTATVFGTHVSQTVTWSTSNRGVVSVNSRGLIGGVSAGTTDIIVTLGYDSTVTDTFTVTVMEIDSVTISGKDSVLAGTSLSLTAEVFGTHAPQRVTWTSINTSKATVDPTTGEVTAVDTGVVNIIATSAVDTTVADTVTITVMSVDSISISTLDGASDSILKGDSITLVADVSVTHGADTGVTWSSDSTEIATVDSVTGKVLAVNGGIATITATSKVDPTQTATREIVVRSVDSISITGASSVLKE